MRPVRICPLPRCLPTSDSRNAPGGRRDSRICLCACSCGRSLCQFYLSPKSTGHLTPMLRVSWKCGQFVSLLVGRSNHPSHRPHIPPRYPRRLPLSHTLPHLHPYAQTHRVIKGSHRGHKVEMSKIYINLSVLYVVCRYPSSISQGVSLQSAQGK